MQRSSSGIRMAFVAVTLGTGCLGGAARAQSGDLPCDAFAKTPTGRGRRRVMSISPAPDKVSPSGKAASCDRVLPSGLGFGLDARQGMSRHSRSAAASRDSAQRRAAGATASSAAASSTVALRGRNGNIDVQRLTCGEIAISAAARSRVFPLVGIYRRSEKARN